MIIFTKNNIDSYMKALSINYRPVFIEFKNFISVLRYCNLKKKFLIQTYGPYIFKIHFSRKFKNVFMKFYVVY